MEYIKNLEVRAARIAEEQVDTFRPQRFSQKLGTAASTRALLRPDIRQRSAGDRRRI
jgi:hypothetical protein